MAIMILPQLGSSPAIAVLTRGEFAIEKAIVLASISFLHFLTFIVINLEAPSPSETTLFAKFNKTLFKALSKFLIFLSLILFTKEFLTLLVAKMLAMSLVLVSPSHVIALKVVKIFFFNNFFKISFDKLASVKI